MEQKNKKVFVGMSGGVDSSVAAYLLKREGYAVTGVFMKVWQPEFVPCSAEDDRRDAMRVAARLGIPFSTFNFEQEYKKDVADYFIAEYAAGRTPNPDVMCNRYIKFGAYLRAAVAQGAEYIATGHYARVKKDSEGYHLLVGINENKDQSYFLHTLGQDELSRTLFPIGNFTKPEVRQIARRAGLPTAEKKDSQGLCFVGKLDMKEFLSHYIPQKRGAVVDTKGVVLGEHEGAAYYTLGQRHGFTARAKSPTTSPYYVVAKNISGNTLTVAHRPSATEHEIALRDTHWTLRAPSLKKRYGARLRYRQELAPCSVRVGSKGDAIITFKKAPAFIPSGQSLVLYDKDECIGGGVIV